MFIQTEETPNPNAIKFLPGLEISPDSIFLIVLMKQKQEAL